MTDYSDSPRFHIWAQPDYNEGKLVGDWIELIPGMTEEDVLQEIHNLLKYYDEGDKVAKRLGKPEYLEDFTEDLPREDWLVGDYEGFPSRFYSESMSFGPVLQWIEDTQEMRECGKEAYELYLDNVGLDSDIEGFESNYIGKYDSEEAYAEQFVEDMGYLQQIPEHLQYYFDYQRYAHDLFINDVHMEGDGHVFRR